MNDLANMTTTTVSMTSLEIADLVESQHGNVCKSIERLAKRAIIQLPPMQKVENKQALSPNNKTNVYIFSGEKGKRDSIIVVAQLSPEFTARLVDRWQELEERKAASLPSPAEIGQGVIEAMLAVATKWKVPTHYALQVAGAEAVRQSGMPWDRLLTRSAYMTDVPNEEVMLEPTELGKLFDLSAVAMNRKLAELGLQEKVGGSWIPTTEGERLCVRHAWVRGGKSGYNLKWNAREIEKLMETEEVV